jgi:hypothetical protein
MRTGGPTNLKTPDYRLTPAFTLHIIQTLLI